MLVWILIALVSGALILGAGLGLSGWLSNRVMGWLIAMAGGALIISITLELIEPAIEQAGLLFVMVAILAGGTLFTCVNYIIDEKVKRSEGSGLLVAVTLDGIPENLALGVALIGAGPGAVAALAGSIFLSNLPEAAGSAKQMRDGGRSVGSILALWSGTAVILAAAALIGYFSLTYVSEGVLGIIRGFAAGTVVVSLASEVFPNAYKNSRHSAGFAVTVGLIFAICLHQLSN
ncbi:membrane protein [Algimonas arctica]|uniref:Membrane protein n=1 Tax=Algimonas arctica TaxID=1479486 RepID=A0A8J3CPM1_9PROT|nr:zinc transporter [Algimonas arctica]GHA82555.1 membrane protein [Algimonas arctica]